MEDQATVLARLLAIAATATASSLVENRQSRVSNLFSRSPFSQSSETRDDTSSSETSFDGFLAGLRSGLLASQLSYSLRNADQARPRRTMNFFRMFRFPPSTDSSSDEPNLVPILIVGVRAVESTERDPEAERTRQRDNEANFYNMFDGTNDNDDHLFSPRERPPWERHDNDMESHNDDTENTREPTSQSENSNDPSRQSWIVYVFGGTYPEDHPILLAPSLFSDEPTYEDLMTLENFMGQVKPPVATSDEVENSGGLFKVRDTNGSVTNLEFTDDDGEVLNHSVEGRRCHVCLSDYEVGQECRKLNNCNHTFHKECIDQWLITGRNSCPLCRGEGVKKHDETADADAAQAAVS